jgi:molybdopterin-binding protein
MKHGARNDLNGTVTMIKSGDVMAHAKVRISGEFDISSVMTAESLEAMKLAEGDKVRVIVKAVSVLLVKD